MQVELSINLQDFTKDYHTFQYFRVSRIQPAAGTRDQAVKLQVYGEFYPQVQPSLICNFTRNDAGGQKSIMSLGTRTSSELVMCETPRYPAYDLGLK